MTLEEQLSALIEAVRENTAATLESNKLRTEGIAEVRAAATPTSRSAAKKTEAPTETPKADAAPQADPVADELRNLVAGYVGATDREAEREARKSKIKALLRHEAICKPERIKDMAEFDVLDIKPDAIDLFKQQIGLLKEAGDLVPVTAAATSLV